MASVKKPQSTSNPGYLDGQMLIAMPTMGDPRFERAVVYLCAHSEEGAMGIVVNKLISGLEFPELLDQLGIETTSPQNKDSKAQNIHFGGPVETARGFVLHSTDFHTGASSMEIGEKICLTATVDILKAMATGDGPKHALMALGYAGWAPGQLEEEIQANGWLHCAADETLLFTTDIDERYNSALAKIGVDPSFLSAEAGHA